MVALCPPRFFVGKPQSPDDILDIRDSSPRFVAGKLFNAFRQNRPFRVLRGFTRSHWHSALRRLVMMWRSLMTLEEIWIRYRVADGDTVTASTTDDELEEVADEWIDQAKDEGDELDPIFFRRCLRDYRDRLQTLEN